MSKVTKDSGAIVISSDSISRIPRVRLIGVDGSMLDIVNTDAAVKMAYDENLDLVMIAPDSDPPVCKILDYGKYKYDLQKKKREAKKKHKSSELKEIQLRPSIGENDLLVKCRAVEKFIRSGNKVKISLRFRGREISKQDIGFAVVRRVIDFVSEYGKEEYRPRLDGQTISVILSAK